MVSFAQHNALGFRYDRTTILLHWLVVALVVLQWVGGRTIDWFPKGALRIDARSVHLFVGAGLAVAVAARGYWKLFRATRAPESLSEPLRLLAVTVHWGLLALLAGVVGLGLVLGGLRGDSLFNLFHLPALGAYAAADRHQLVEQLTDLHGLGANVLLALAGLHAAAALVHQYVFKDNLLRRMM